MNALLVAYAVAPSLADPDGSSPLVAAVRWLEGVALGSVATGIALIAVASIGFLMLSGRMQVRRGATVILGCFILFGAPVIAAGLSGSRYAGAEMPVRTTPAPSPLVAVPRAPATPLPATRYDPYAGAAVPPR